MPDKWWPREKEIRREVEQLERQVEKLEEKLEDDLDSGTAVSAVLLFVNSKGEIDHGCDRTPE